MPVATEVRSRLSAQQAALVSALMAHGDLPEGFDRVRLHAAAASLARKRVRGVARAWPGLARALGPRFRELFAAYSESARPAREGGPLADGRAFARWLAAREQLPEAGRLQAMAVDLRFTGTPQGLVPKQSSAWQIALLRQSRRLVVAVRLKWLGEHWLSIPLGRRSNVGG